MRVTLPVSGMTCAACQSRVQRALTKAPGVKEASVNLMLNNATVTFDEHVATPEALVDAVRATGYGAELPVDTKTAFDEQEASDRSREAEFKELGTKAVVSLVIGLVMMIGPMVGLPITLWMELVATVCVMAWAGRRFYVRAWKAIRHGSADMNTLITVGTGAAFLFSLVATLDPALFSSHGLVPRVYYEAVVLIIALVGLATHSKRERSIRRPVRSVS